MGKDDAAFLLGRISDLRKDHNELMLRVGKVEDKASDLTKLDADVEKILDTLAKRIIALEKTVAALAKVVTKK